MENQKSEVKPASTPANSAVSVESIDLASLAPEQAVDLFVQDPVQFVKQIVAGEAIQHLAQLKEEAELRGAVAVFKRNNPDFARFEPLIMQEVVGLIKNDPDGHIAPWEDLLKKALELFQGKFKEMVDEGIISLNQDVTAPPVVEAATTRSLPKPLPQFNRAQIANMSMQDYLKNEAAIDEALKGKRIQ